MTRNFKIAFPAMLIASLSLSGCLPAIGNNFGNSKAIKSHTLADGTIVVNAPDAYCVDQSARASNSFVLMTNCDLLSGKPSTAQKERGVLTVNVGAPLSADVRDLSIATAFGSAGVSSDRVEGLVLEHVKTDGEPRLAGAAARYWRGAMKMQGRIVTLSLYGPEDGYLLDQSGQRVLESLAAGIKQAPPETGSAVATIENKNAFQGAFRRLFQINQSGTQ